MVRLLGRRMAWGWIRRAGVLLGASLMGALALACSDTPVAAPKHFGPGHASLSLTPTFAALPAGAPSIQLSKITAALVGPNGDSILVTSTFDGDSAILVFDLQITGSTENFTLNLTAFDHDGVVAYKSTQSVAIKPGDNPGVPAPILVYAAPDAAIQALHVSPSSMTMNAGTSGSLSVTGTGANGQSVPPLRIGWTSRDPSIATVDDGGGVQAGAFQGTTWIVARTPNNVADSAQITVKAAVAQVSLSASSLQLVRGTGGSIVARLLDSGGRVIDDRVATWSSSDPSVATVSSSGAVQGIKVGTATLTATAEGKSATATVTVVSPIDHVELSPSSLTFAALGQTQSVVAKVVARAGASVDGLVPALASSNPFIATVDGSGTVTALSNGSTTITAAADGVSATTSVTVKQVAVSVTVSPASATATAVGDATTFTAAAFDAAKNAMPTSTIAWSSSDASVASVNSDGVAVALKGGSTTITATSGAIAGSGSLTVSQIAQKIALSADKTSFMVTQSATVTARVLDQNDNLIPGVKPQWSTSAPTIATVTQDGTVTGVAVGTVRITAAYDGVTANISLQVTSLPAVTLTLNAPSANVLPAGTAQFSVTSGGTGPFAWTVNDVAGGSSTIGTVSSTGLYTAPNAVPSPASVSVCATQVSPPGHVCATVTISALPVLDVSSTSVIVGNTHQFSVASGGNGPFTWLVNNAVSGNATFGMITSTGLYTAPVAVPSPATFDVCATQASPAATACSHVTVQPTPTTTLVLNATTAALRTGASTTFAVVSGGTGPFTWMVNDAVGGKSTVGTVDGSGLYTAPATAPASPVSVCASQVSPSGKACVLVTVSAPPTLDVSALSLFTNDTHQFAASGGTPPFTWSVNNITGGSSTLGTVSATGLYTAPATVAASPTTVAVCVSQSIPLAQTCAQVSVTASITLNVTTASLRTGATTGFGVVSSGSGGPFTWTVNDVAGGNSTVGTVTTDGQYTAPAVAPSSPVSVCATQVNPTGKGCVLVSVSAPPTLDVSTLSLFTGGTHQFIASGGTAPFTWSVNSVTGGSASTGTVDATGLYTGPATVTASPTTVVVCVGQSTPLAQTCAQVTVTASIVLNVSTASLRTGATTGFGVVSGGSTGPFTWTVNDSIGGTTAFGKVTTSGTVTSSASYTAPSTPPSAPVTVCASQVNPTGRACVVVTISAPPTVDTPTLSMLTNDTHVFTASGGTGPFTWTVSSPGGSDPATIGTVSQTGSYTAPSTVPSPPLVLVCVNQASPLAQTCANVTIVTLNISSSTTQIAFSRSQQFTVSGGTTPYTWTVNNGASGFGSITVSTTTAVYTAPSTLPSPLTFPICVSESSRDAGKICSQVTVVGGLSGRVTNGSSETISGISGATVTAANGATTTTADDGTFVLIGADADSTLTISATDFVSADYFNALSSSSTITQLGNIPLAPTSSSDGSVTGHVVDLTSSPIVGATVTIRHGAHSSHAPIETKTTNCDGNYTFSPEHPGTYTVTVTSAGYTSESTTFTIVGHDTTTQLPTITIRPNSSQ